jgi:fucose permease
VPAFRLACLAYLSVALPASTLGLLWPLIRISFQLPVAALGILLAFGTAATVIASAVSGRLLSRLTAGPLLAVGTALTAVALTAEAFTPSVWLFGCGMACFGLGCGAINAAINVHAAHHFSARQINWTHASYGAGATLGPLLATLLLSSGFSWHWVYGLFAGVQAVLALLFAVTGRGWAALPRPPERSAEPRKRRRPTAVVLGSLAFIAVETGIETGAGIWGYVFLIQGRGLTHAAAGVALSAYWAMMFLGRVVLGAVAGRVGPSRVLAAAVAGVSLGCALMTVPGPGLLAVAGLVVVGLAAAPIFPLFTLTTAQRVGASGTTVTVSLQTGASSIGSAALPAAIGLSIGAFTATALAPQLLVLSLTMWVLFRLLSKGRESIDLDLRWTL